ncbi:MAG: hypothetical protein GY727_08145 [Gammaproteobacteria bacterium]|nr:hypothetical protein [Gammaproteobacteria bacterium]MCP4088730.1 hypothetical protein [Gammaproteobacteria bacterium]MCP4275227.1 hypothetical protein [Gammaproteobacteria bacterium]MCP4830763.1 hypothetical protein [Gammaproteobacteria bacterium]MCP4929552.1 hypothetical protein [Gammaproteobacteria bacterium]
MSNTQQQGRRMLLFISLLFITPIIAAMYMYLSGTAIPLSSIEHGELITPPRILPETALNTSVPEQRFRDVWSLLVSADSHCDADCLVSLEKIRQVRLSLGPKMTRIQTVFLPASETAIGIELATEHPKLIIASPEQSGIIRPTLGAYKNGEIFLVDPLGNLIMRYPQDAEMGNIREDITHLLKLSNIG